MTENVTPYRRTVKGTGLGGHGRRYVCLLLLGVLWGCRTVGPDYTPPVLAVPDAWHQTALVETGTGEGNLRDWWTVFGDPVLEQIIRRAARNSPDLRIAAARIDEARARYGAVFGQRYPQSAGSGRMERGRGGDFGFGTTGETYAMGMEAGWEIDLWGRIARSIESAGAGIEASAEVYRDTLVFLYAEIALNYVEARKLQARIRYAEANAATQHETLGVTRSRLKSEIAPALDVHQAELNLAATESAIPLLKSGLNQVINRLAVLSGEFPGALHGTFAAGGAIPAPPERTLVGLPADLLRRRPDIRMAERRLASQTARIGAATGELYPAFSLFGTFGLHSLSPWDLLESGSRYWSFGPSFRWNLFNGGRIRSRIRAEEALTRHALAAYERTVLLAVEEVENAMNGYVMEKERCASLGRSVAAAEKSVVLVDQLYRIGLTDFQNLLDMQRSLFQQQDALAKSEGNVTAYLIRLYKALGGGWHGDHSWAVPGGGPGDEANPVTPLTTGKHQSEKENTMRGKTI